MVLQPLRVSVCLAAAALLAGAVGADVNRIVLRVNDEIATLYEFEQRRRSRINEIQRADLPEERRQRLLADVGAETLREMYEELLVLSRASQLDIRISEREVEAAMQRTRGQFGIESDEEFRAALAASGMTVDDLREQMRRNLRIREVMGREVQQRIQLEEEDLRRYYRDHPEEFTRPRRLRVQEVVVSDDAAADAAARAELAAEVREALLAGEEGGERLTELAEAGRTTGVLELGWVERGDLEAGLERAIWQLEPGSVSEPVDARGGLHVLQVLEEETALLLPFADVQDGIRQKLSAGRYQEEMTSFLAELEESSYVEQRPPPEAAGFRLATERSRSDELSGFALAPEAAPEEVPEEAPDEAPEEAPDEAPEEAPDEAPEEAPESDSGDGDEGAADAPGPLR